MKSKEKLCLLLSLIMLTTTILTGCKAKVENEDKLATVVPDTLTVARSGEPATLNQLTHTDAPSDFASRHLYDTLVYNNEETGKIEPMLAEKWEQIDDKTIRFYLRKDVKSHAGDPFTANDVKFTVMQAKESPQKGSTWRPFDFDACKVIDEYTIDIVTKNPYSSALVLLSTDGADMMVEKSFKDAGGKEENDRKPKCGTGSFKLKEWIAGDRIVFERNEDYWGKKPGYKTLVIRNITDDTSRALALESGDIDICLDVLPAQVESLTENPDVDVLRNPMLGTVVLGLNCQHGPLQDVRVRKALHYALDVPGMVKLAFSGVGLPADGPMSPAMTAYCPPKEDEIYTQDIEKAKALLKEAGYADGFTIKLWTNENQARIDLCEMINNAWEKIGVKAEVQIMEFAMFCEKLDAGEHDAYIIGWVASANDGDFMHDTFYSKLSWVSNTPGYKNPRLDEIVDAARLEFDQDKRQEYYNELQSIIRKELPWIPIQFGENVVGIRSTLTGYKFSTCSGTRMDTIVPKNK